MALFCHETAGTSCLLMHEHLIGRGPECALRLQKPYVSTQHALIRWNGMSWELLDRGSHNGTRLNGSRIESKRPYPLEQGAAVTFGHSSESWVLREASAPQVMVVNLDEHGQVVAADGVIGLPSNEHPKVTLYRSPNGVWKLEQPDVAAVTIEDGALFEVEGRRYRFCQPRVAGRTVTIDAPSDGASATLVIAVSSDEEFVELSIELPDRRVALGSRNHNYLLLMLARAREADTDCSEASRGWMYKEDVARGLRMTSQQIDGEVFRVRKHLAQHGLDQAADVIERRPRTRQLRLGLPRFRIERS